MDKDNNQKASHMGRYLILWFLIIMIFIYLFNLLDDMLIQKAIWPFISRIMNFDEIDMNQISSLTLVKYLTLVIFNSTIARIPGARLAPLTGVLAQKMGVTLIVPAEVYSQGQLAVFGYTIALIICFFILMIISLIPYVCGGIWYVLLVKRKMDELIEEDRRRAKEIDSQRNLMLSDIAHDIKTPITAMSGYAKALNDGLVPEEKHQEYLSSIYSKSMRVSDLINMMFEYIKLDSAGYKLNKSDGDLAELCRQVAADQYQDFEDAGLSLDIDIPEEECIYNMDSLQLSRVIANLCSNAIKYLEPGRYVLLQMKKSEYMVWGKPRYTIRVADNGPQIDDDLAESIFVPFTRGDTTRSTRGGTGLGLSIAHKIVELHGGELTLNRKLKDEYTKAFEIRL